MSTSYSDTLAAPLKMRAVAAPMEARYPSSLECTSPPMNVRDSVKARRVARDARWNLGGPS
jgi:hypothetical protein